jgi:hypothetical protein
MRRSSVSLTTVARFAGKQCEAQCGVLLLASSRRLVTRVFTVRMQNMQVFLVLKA